MGTARGLAAGSLVLAGCSVLAPLGGLTGGEAPVDAGPSDAAVPEAGADAGPDVGRDAEDGARPDATEGSPGIDAPVASDGPVETGAEAGATYASTVLSDSPLAYWRLDETTGTTAHDATGNGNDATYTGGYTQGAAGALIGDPDTAATLDGVSGYVDAGDRFNFAGNAPHTLEIWALPANIGVSYQRLFSRELSTTPREGYLVFVRGPNAADPSTFSVERWAGGAANQCPQTASISQVWHHFVATYDGATSRVYLDGTLAAAQPAALALSTTTASLWIGASVFDTAALFAGSVDEVAVYGTALSAARISAHFHASGR
jgi:hypothetical protein